MTDDINKDNCCDTNYLYHIRNRNLKAKIPIGFIEEMALSNDLDAIICCTTYWVKHIFNSERSSIALKQENELLKVISNNSEHTIYSLDIPIETSFIGGVFSKKTSDRSDDNRSRNKFDSIRLVECGYLSTISSPLVYKEKCYGTINVSSKEINSYIHDDVIVLEAISKLVAAKIMCTEEFERLYSESRLDNLTHTFNRLAFKEKTSLLIKDNESICSYSTLMIIDIDNFKFINDNFGHIVGDKILIHLASTIKNSIHPSAFVSRFGGDEFMVCILDTNKYESLRIAELIRSKIERSIIEYNGQYITYTISIGATIICNEDSCIDDAILRADNALYRSKDRGKNTVTIICRQDFKSHTEST